jgi:hypothetical protein
VFKTVAAEMLNRVNFQFQLCTLFVCMLSASVALAWYSWFTNGYYDVDYPIELDAFDWWPGWLGFFAGLGFVGSILVFRREPLLAEQIFVMSWLLVSTNTLSACYEGLTSYIGYNGAWPWEIEAIHITRWIIVRSMTVPVVLLPLFLLRTGLLCNVFRRPHNRLFFFITLCNCVLLIAMVRYLFLRNHFM